MWSNVQSSRAAIHKILHLIHTDAGIKPIEAHHMHGCLCLSHISIHSNGTIFHTELPCLKHTVFQGVLCHSFLSFHSYLHNSNTAPLLALSSRQLCPWGPTCSQAHPQLSVWQCCPAWSLLQTLAHNSTFRILSKGSNKLQTQEPLKLCAGTGEGVSEKKGVWPSSVSHPVGTKAEHALALECIELISTIEGHNVFMVRYVHCSWGALKQHTCSSIVCTFKDSSKSVGVPAPCHSS